MENKVCNIAIIFIFLLHNRLFSKLHELNQMQPKINSIIFSKKGENKLHLVALITNHIFEIFLKDAKIAKNIIFLVIYLYFLFIIEKKNIY